MGLETCLDIETKSRDSITAKNFPHQKKTVMTPFNHSIAIMLKPKFALNWESYWIQTKLRILVALHKYSR